MLLLVVDTETTGLSFTEDRIVELGMVMYSVEFKKPVRMEGFMVKPECDFTPEQWEPAQKVHGISWQEVNEFGTPDDKAFKVFLAWYKMADGLAGHNICLFDKLMFDAWAERYGRPLDKKLIVDTRTDLPDGKSGKLIHLAAEYGFVNPLSHRALTDALTTLKILEIAGMEAAIERAKQPNVIVQATVSFANRDRAKERGYYWQPETKRWLRNLKDGEVAKEQAEAPFPVVVVEVQQN